MNDGYLKVYSQAGKLLGILDNAGEIAYTLPHNDLWTASFTLPSHDPKNALCAAHNMVRIPDGGGSPAGSARDLGLYRIVGMPTSEETATGGVKTYTLEHVMATLLDDVLFGYHEIGGPGVTTAQVIRYILARQTTQRWALGVCEFNDQFVYKFENTSLLSALLSLGNVLVDEYTWDFDTSTTPWTVNLRHADAAPGCGIHYMRNMVGIEKTMDATTLVTRLYLLGYGEGVNQLTIRDVNNGLPYIDADTVSVWGVKASVYADTRIEDAATLKARGRAVLDRYKNPYISYTASAIDLTRLTGQEWDKHMPGKLVRVMDDEHGINFAARIVSISKSDVRGRPGDIEITIANAPRDAADSINTLADRMGIAELYSQGATNLYSQQYADNADAAHPARMRVYVPSGCVRINQMLLSWQLSAFRAYETGAAAGGSTVTSTSAGGASTQTSSAGGASERTSRSGGAYAQTLAQHIVTTQAVTGGTIAGHSGDTSGNTSGARNSSGDIMTSTGSSGTLTTGRSSILTTYSSSSALVTGENGEHSHSGPSHSHSFSDSYSLAWGHTHGIPSGGSNTSGVNNYSAKTISVSGTTGSAGSGDTGSAGKHRHSMAPHTHEMEHTHDLSGHSHSMAHYHNFSHSHNVVCVIDIPAQDITIPAHSHVFETSDHTHRVSIPEHTHDVTLGDHTHAITHGIYEGGTATTVTLKVDGNTVPTGAITNDEMDIVAYLAKDEDGKITRGTWHEIEIVPNGLTRIEVNLFVQTFVQSVGGGDF